MSAGEGSSMSGPKSEAFSTTVRPAVGMTAAQSSCVGISPKFTQQWSCQGETDADNEPVMKLPSKAYTVVRMQCEVQADIRSKNARSAEHWRDDWLPAPLQ